MTGNKRIDSILYGLGDYIAATLAWAIFYYMRKTMVLSDYPVAHLFQEEKFLWGIVLIPLGWMLCYLFFGEYGDIYRFSRLRVLTTTLFITTVGCILIFFTLLLDDTFANNWTFYSSIFTLFLLHFVLTASFRMIQLTLASHKLKNRKVHYNTLLVGSRKSAESIYSELTTQVMSQGQRFVGYIVTNGHQSRLLSNEISPLGKVKDIHSIVAKHHIEEVVIAIEPHEQHLLEPILNGLFQYDNILIKIIPGIQDIMLGKVKMNYVYGALLIEIDKQLMPIWQQTTKRLMDIVGSILALIILSPVFAFTAWRVRTSSKGPIIFAQERVGKSGRPFTMYKFRSMYVDAEKDGPQLSSDDDDRSTPWGAVMRKWRLDEFPQFWNVLKGNMSLVGPRPERRFFIEQILKEAPHHRHLLKVKPGITSWGQVKYGYASSIEEMLQRLNYDILYIENMSLALDIKIMFYTVFVVFQGRGK